MSATDELGGEPAEEGAAAGEDVAAVQKADGVFGRQEALGSVLGERRRQEIGATGQARKRPRCRRRAGRR